MKIIFIKMIFILTLTQSVFVIAAQYRSQELIVPNSINERKSIEQLEAEINSISSDYSKSSTSRYLARYFAGNKDLKKAEKYYVIALEGEGLSSYAKQDLLEELGYVLFQLKNYTRVLQIYDQRKNLGGKDKSIVLLQVALSAHFMNLKDKALTFAKSAETLELKGDIFFFKQLLFIYFNNQAFDRAEKVQKDIIKLNPNDMEAWRYLSAIYMKTKQTIKALDALTMARQKKLIFTESDLITLIDLQAKVGNPYAAARILKEALDSHELKSSLDMLEKLFTFWMLAKEREEAINTLQLIVENDKSIERYLLLARLQMEAQQWESMKNTVLQACSLSPPDEYISSANLLLGVSELKLGNRVAARSAFINATLIGGESERAQLYLKFMSEEEVSASETEVFSGSCLPKWAMNTVEDSFLDSFGDEESIAKDFSFKRVKYNIAVSKPKVLVKKSFSFLVVEMKDKVLPNAIALGMYITKNGGHIDGDMHFISHEPIRMGAEVVNFDLAFPVRRKPQMNGQYRLIEEKGFKAANLIYEGSLKGLLQTSINFYSTVLEDKLALTGESRMIILSKERTTKDKIKVQLEIGVK